MIGFLTSLFIVLVGSSIFLMPIWIVGVSQAMWSILAKKVMISAMVVISIIFTVIVILKPTLNRAAGILANVLIILYLLIVFTVAYRSWPR